MGKKKKKVSSIDRFARITSVISLIISGFAIIIQCKQDKTMFGEDIVSIVSREYLDNGELQLSLRNIYRDDLALIRVPYRYTISNNGNRMSSIINYVIEVKNGEDWEKRQLPIPNQLFLDGKPVSIPINIESGETRSFILYVNKVVSIEVYDILDSLNSADGSIRYIKASLVLAKNGIDLFGNKFEYSETKHGRSQINYDSYDFPEITVKATTSRKNIITAQINKSPMLIH